MRSFSSATVLALVLAAAVGCHSMRFDVAEERPVEETVYQRKAFFLWGLAPTREVVLTDYCPHGVVAVREERRFTDGLLELITLGIYSPRSSWYLCAAGDEEMAARGESS